MKEEPIGYAETPDGKLEIVDYVKTNSVKDRSFTLLKLADGSIVINLDSDIHGKEKRINQQMRLTPETFSLMMLAMAQADKQFDIKAVEYMNWVFGENGGMDYETPKKQEG